MVFQLPRLPFAYDAYEPVIDARTMEIHHTKHHQAYIDNLNKAVVGTPAEGKSLEELFATMSVHTPAVRNNGGGHRNHSFFWTILAPVGSTQISPAFKQVLAGSFGSVVGFQEQFAQTALARFGSGRVRLVKTADGKLVISSTPNQDNPLMDIAEVRGTPLLGLDVWEHAYYLNYQNRRAEYVQKFRAVVNWKRVEELYGV